MISHTTLRFSSLRNLMILIAFLVMVSNAVAHEFWIHPDKLSVTPGSLVSVQLMHGERFAGNVVPRDEHQIKRYEFIGTDDSTQQLRGMHQSSTSYLKPRTSGIVVYQSNRYQNNLEAERFESYLKEERLDHIIDERAKLNESDALGREIYSRNSKSIIRVKNDDHSIDQIDSPVGLPLEIIIEQINPKDPQSTDSSAQVSAIVLLNGKPIPELRVVATSELHHDQLIELTTNDQGVVRFDAVQPGRWMISTLYIQRETKTGDADWESFWSSTTFEIIEIDMK